MADDYRKQTIDWLRDWSKWLITLDFAAVTGCTVVLQLGVKGPPRPYLLLAIAAFSLSVVIAIAVVRALSTALEVHSESDAGETSVLERKLLRGVSIRWGTRLQVACMILGVLSFLTWVALKPPPPAAKSANAGPVSSGDSQVASTDPEVTDRLGAMERVIQEIQLNTSFIQAVRQESLDSVSSLSVEINGLRQASKLLLDIHHWAKLSDHFESIDVLLSRLHRTLGGNK